MKGLNDGEDPPIKLFDSTHWRNAGLVVMIRTMVMCQKETDTHYGTAILELPFWLRIALEQWYSCTVRTLTAILAA